LTITIKEIEAALKNAGTYIGTAIRVDAQKEEKK
jgi:hypothetical protein